MSETPRLRSAFPATPRTEHRVRSSSERRSTASAASSTSARQSPITKPIQRTASVIRPNDGPLVSLDVLDAPTQRLYVAAFYIALWAWRLYNSLNVTDELDSTWLFLKWLGIDAAFFVALPAFRIPWLEWSFTTTLTLWLLHAIANTFLMYKIPIPLLSWAGAAMKVAYDRELAISEHRVKPGDIIHNSSIILGKQIIQILPEGSAVLNPQKLSFCLDADRTTAALPIQINQTSPISIELVRYDLETEEQESIVINQKAARKLKVEADRGHARSDTNTPRLLHYPVTRKGLYRLTRVVDESKLDVRRRSYDVAVVSCPKAAVTADVQDKCTGDLSGVTLEITGVPPFKVQYIKRINQHQSSSISQTIQPPEDVDEDNSKIIADPKRPQMGWTQAQSLSVQINESLHQNGTWSYHVEEVEDGLGNKATFNTDTARKSSAERHSTSLTVHGRPIINLKGCNSQHALRIAQGDSTDFPIEVKSFSQIPASDWPLNVRYTFVAESDSEAAVPEEESFDLSIARILPRISKAGKYVLESVESRFCRGEVNEPSSCSLYNPPRPSLSMQSEIVSDKCAGNPIGIIVSLDFTGTPPFKVRYTESHSGRTVTNVQKFDSMRGKITFRGERAGSYTYEIVELEDQVYGPTSLRSQDLVLKQNIKPPARAQFESRSGTIRTCLGQSVSMPVSLHGEGPWDLEYEIVHGGKRRKFSLHTDASSVNLDIADLKEGGKYSVVLTGVRDKNNCRNTLTDERDVEVRGERPSAAFGDIEGQRTIQTLEGKHVKVPLRMKGVGPWTVQIQNTKTDSSPQQYVLREANGAVTLHQAGTYELISVQDSCPGIIDAKMNTFSISWIERPTMSLRDDNLDQTNANHYRKSPVCQGYEDSLGLSFTGHGPFQLKYDTKSEPLKGQIGQSEKSLSIASSNAVIKLDTSRAGEYTYTFKKLEDDRYSHDKRHFKPLAIKQRVYALPDAKFVNSGKTYSYCKEDPTMSDNEVENIPISLTGTPPFIVEIAVTRHGISQRPEIKRISDIPSNTFQWAVSRSSFDLGAHTLQLRSVKDSHGCESVLDTDASSVRIHVSSPPTINPLEVTTDYCVGDRVSFSLSGQAPFSVFYTFQGRERKAQVNSHEFKRITDAPGDFVITGVSDSAMGGGGKCRARKDIRKTIHPFPSVRIEKGQTKIDDIHEGGEVDIHFEFTGTPPFEFTFIRSENLPLKSKIKSKKPAILETRHETSDEYRKIIRATEEGTYEVVAIKDRYCAYSTAGAASTNKNSGSLGWKDQKLLKG